MFLLPWFGRSNLRRMADLAFDSQLFHQAQKPLHRSRCFDPHAHQPWQPRIKLLHVTATVCQRLLHHLPGSCIEHRQCLLASVQIASYNSHLGLLRSEHCWGEHRTVYSGRREADIVMTSTGKVGNRTKMPGYEAFLKSQNRNDEAFYWVQQLLEKKRTLPRYRERIERPWFRKG